MEKFFSSAMLRTGFLPTMLRTPPPAYPISMTSAFFRTSSAMGPRVSPVARVLDQWSISRKRKGISMRVAILEKVAMCEGATTA